MSDSLPATPGAQRGKPGGEARARALTPAQRSRISRAAARSRWNPEILVAEHGSPDKPVLIGELALPCYVLTGGLRVFSQRGLFNVLGLRSRGSELERFIDQTDLRKHLSDENAQQLLNPLHFRLPGGGRAYGYPATLLIDVCNAVVEASKEPDFPKHFTIAAIKSDLIVRAVAKVGIIALVDEATGYDSNREETLQAILELFLRKELAAWMKRFPDEYYEQICRLKNWKWHGRPTPTPWALAGITTDLVYSRLAPGIVAQLEKINPRIDRRRAGKHHQFLTEEVGHPALAQHLHTLVSFMRVSDSWDQLTELVNKALPKQDDNIQLRLLDWQASQS